MSEKRGTLGPSQVVASFWARFLDSKVASDGQVPGYASWCSKATTHALKRGAIYAESCRRKVESGRSVEEVITAGVAAFRGELRMHRMAVDAKDPEYAKFRFQLNAEILRDGLRPFEVAAMLERERERFTQIRDDEIDELREWDLAWGGPIEEGRLVWNPRTHALESWPHAAVPVFKPEPQEVKAAAPLKPPSPADAYVVAMDPAVDEAPPPEYADEAPPPEVAT